VGCHLRLNTESFLVDCFYYFSVQDTRRDRHQTEWTDTSSDLNKLPLLTIDIRSERRGTHMPPTGRRA
jgi:hypothetical protein